MLNRLFGKHKYIIPYLFFGILTTVINWGVYKLFYSYFDFANVLSVVIAFILSVLFAFITNKIWVFGSKEHTAKAVLKQAASFFAARFITGLLDIGIMWISVDLLNGNADAFKIISNVIVVIINYILSKFLIFSRKNTDKIR